MFPGSDSYTPWTLDQYERLELGGPRQLPEAWFIAKGHGRYVGMSVGKQEAAFPDTLHQSYTCTLRAVPAQGHCARAQALRDRIRAPPRLSADRDRE